MCISRPETHPPKDKRHKRKVKGQRRHPIKHALRKAYKSLRLTRKDQRRVAPKIERYVLALESVFKPKKNEKHLCPKTLEASFKKKVLVALSTKKGAKQKKKEKRKRKRVKTH